MMKYSRKQLKRSAKTAVAAARPRAWLITLVFLVMCLAVSWAFNAISPEPFTELTEPFADAVEEVIDYIEDGDLDPDELMEVFVYTMEDELERIERRYDSVEEFVFSAIAAAVSALLISALLSFISVCVTKILEYGYRGYCLSLYRGKSPSFKNLFCAFPRTLQVVGSHIMVAVFSALWSLLITVVAVILCVVAAFLLKEAGVFVAIAVALFAVVLRYFITTLRYAQTPYVVVDRRDLGVFASISRSKQLMRGGKFKLFFLRLSFLGWQILVSLIVSVITLIGIVLGILMLVGGKVGACIAFMAVFAVAAQLAALPLNLWLTAYKGTAEAGLYHMLAEAKPIATDPVPEAAAPAEVPVVETVPVEGCVETPVVGYVEPPVEDFGEAAVEIPPEAPVEDFGEAAVEIPPEAPVENFGEVTVELSPEVPVESYVEVPVENFAEAAVEDPAAENFDTPVEAEEI